MKGTSRGKSADRPEARRSTAELVSRRQREIAEVATQLVAEKGFAKTLMRDIARGADVSVGTVYEYIRSKDDILFLIIEYWSGVWRQGLDEALAVSADPAEQLRSAVEFLVRSSDEHPELVHLLYREQGNLNDTARGLLKKYEVQRVKKLAGVIAAAAQLGQLPPQTNPEVGATTIIVLADAWSLKGYILHKAQTADDWVEVIWRALSAPELLAEEKSR